MTEYRRAAPRTAGERLYRALLRAYPRDFRDEFGDAMLEFHRDRLADARRGGRWSAATRVWGRVIADLATNAVPARADVLVRRLRRWADARDATRHTRSLTLDHREDFMLSSVIQDTRYALRGMRKSPGFTLTVLATLALGIGASVATFSAVHAVLLKPLPFRDPATLVRLDHLAPYQTVSEPEFADYRRDARSLAQLAAYSASPAMLAADAGGEPERLRTLLVSDGFFPTLGARMALGRAFTADEEVRGGPLVVVISHGLWIRRFGGDSSAVGRQIVLNDYPRTVVGVLAPGAEFPSPEVAAWRPMRLNYDALWTRNNHYLTVIGRLAADAGVEQASAEVAALAQRFTRDFPETYSPDQPLIVRVAPLASVTVADVRPYLVTLFGAVLFVLAIACVNVANLLLARGEARRKELAIRSAMGANGLRVARQALTESLLFAAMGGVAGVALAAAGVRALRAFVPANVPRAGEIAVEPAVLLFALVVTLATGLLFGMLPAMRSTRGDSADTLREGGRTSAAGQRGLGRLRRPLVVSEVALSMVTLAGAGLMLRSLWNLRDIDLGFRPENVLAVSVTPPASYTPERSVELYRRLVAEARALPGVVAAAAVEYLPIADGLPGWSILIDGAAMTSVANSPAATPQKVTSGYFDVMRRAPSCARSWARACARRR